MSIAIVQAGTAIYDTPSTLDKLERLTKEAASHGARLIVFPEAFVGGYPKGLDFGIVLGTRSPEGREEFRKYYNSAIEENGPESRRIAEIACANDVIIVTGVVERQGGTLYCSVFFYSPDGYLGKHRKLMPTAMERCVWGNGDGSTMPE
ncbi:aliphatic nitrilase domain protein [Ancylostoma duodenale]|uniref:Aliphatic nitrilase domain protein n=1 Tax=Ancylostoma duodenale TaxID=51022 RepID=A0A0C2CT57_9BILA|nr:aliphatic nitrilase domain protein [Ancylostoma duodenale]